MKLSESVKPISYLKAHASEIMRDIADNRKTCVITQTRRRVDGQREPTGAAGGDRRAVRWGREIPHGAAASCVAGRMTRRVHVCCRLLISAAWK